MVLCFCLFLDPGHWPAWARVMSDMEALASGEVDGRAVAAHADGTPLSFALLFVKGDEEVRSNEFGLTHFGGKVEVCSECMAAREVRPWTDLREEAEWRRTERMDLATFKTRIREPLHPVAASPLFCHRQFFILDPMHLCDCHGVTSTVIGRVLGFCWLVSKAVVDGCCCCWSVVGGRWCWRWSWL